MSCMSSTARYCTNLGPIGPPIRQKCCNNPFASISNYRHSIETSPFNDTIETLACRASGRGVGKARVPLLYGSVEQAAVLRVNVVSDYVMTMTAKEKEGGAVGGSLNRSITAGPATMDDTDSGRRRGVDDEEAQVIVRGVAGTSVKVPGPPSSFHTNTSLKSEQVFLFKRFDITFPEDNNNSVNEDNDQPTRLVHQLDPIVIDPSWPSSSVHPQGWVRYTVELMSSRNPRYTSVVEFWVHNNNSMSPSLPQEKGSDTGLADSEPTAVVTGSIEEAAGLFLLNQGHPWNVQLLESTAVYELGQTISLRLLSSIEQTDHIRLALVQKRTLRGKGIVGTSEVVVQELVGIELFTHSHLHQLGEHEGERMDQGVQREEEEVGTVVQLKLPSAPVLAPSTRTMYLDIEHSLVLSRMVPEKKTKSIVSEVPITIVAPRRQASDQGTKAVAL